MATNQDTEKGLAQALRAWREANAVDLEQNPFDKEKEEFRFRALYILEHFDPDSNSVQYLRMDPSYATVITEFEAGARAEF